MPARRVIESFAGQKLRIVTAESCTGGMIAAALTDVPGASAVLERGFVAYSNEAKIEELGVPAEMIATHGAVSPETAEAMASGALAASHADIALAVTGIAGPDGGTAAKPVGLVYFGLATRDGHVFHYTCRFPGDRAAIRAQAVEEGLKLLLSRADT